MSRLRRMSGYAGGVMIAAVVLAHSALSSAGEISPGEKLIFQEKCSPCHSTSRLLSVAPDQVRETIVRMEAKDPAFFKGVSGDRLAAIAGKMLNDPEIIAQRKALVAAVERGRALFNDTSLGRNGKSCADCHSEDSLRGKAEEFPKFNADQGRLMSLNDTINLMISKNMVGKVLPLGDERAIALETYLKFLR